MPERDVAGAIETLRKNTWPHCQDAVTLLTEEIAALRANAETNRVAYSNAIGQWQQAEAENDKLNRALDSSAESIKFHMNAQLREQKRAERAEAEREALRGEVDLWRLRVRGILEDLPDKPYDAEGTCREILDSPTPPPGADHA